MFHQCSSYILVFSSLQILSIAYKTDTWPPKILQEHYDMPSTVAKCKGQCSISSDQIQEFEMTTDLVNLPNSTELKCYNFCYYVELGFMKLNSTKTDFSSLIDLVSKMTDEEIDKYIKMSKGCTAQFRKMKDPVEVAYQLNVCMKRNAPELYYIYY